MSDTPHSPQQPIDFQAIAATVNSSQQSPLPLLSTLDERSRQQAQRQLADDADIDLMETAPPPIEVMIRDYKLVDVLDSDGKPVLDEQGKPRKERSYFNRHVFLQAEVPTKLLFETISLQKQVAKLQKATVENMDEADIQAGASLFATQVWKAWMLTEPDMTYEHFIEVVPFKKVKGLFARFFGNLNG